MEKQLKGAWGDGDIVPSAMGLRVGSLAVEKSCWERIKMKEVAQDFGWRTSV